MDAVTLINDSLDVEKILAHYDFSGVESHGDILRARCKIHGGPNPTSFVINEDTGLWYCHAGCGGGDVVTLARTLDDSTFPQAVSTLASILNIDINNMELNKKKSDDEKEMSSWFKLMTKRRDRVEMEEYHIEEEVKEVTKFRDFEQATLKHFELGHVERVTLSRRDETTYQLRNRLVIPIKMNGASVGVSLRRTKATDIPKWSHQPINIKTSNLLYNYDSTLNAKSVVVVEGAFDVWAFHEIGIPAVATYGAHLTDDQYRLLLQCGADLVLAYDGDGAGRTAQKNALEALRGKANLYTMYFSDGEDPASIKREELRDKYETRRKR